MGGVRWVHSVEEWVDLANSEILIIVSRLHSSQVTEHCPRKINYF